MRPLRIKAKETTGKNDCFVSFREEPRSGVPLFLYAVGLSVRFFDARYPVKDGNPFIVSGGAWPGVGGVNRGMPIIYIDMPIY